MSPKSQTRSPCVMEQSWAPVPASIDQSRPGLVGNGSSSWTSVATPGPALDTVIVNPTWSAASTDWSSATLVTEMLGQFTVIVTSPDSAPPSLVVLALAAFVTTPQVAAVVGEEMCTSADRPVPRSPKSQVRTPLSIEQSAAFAPPSIDQFRPAFVGRVSVNVTPLDVPSPLFVTVIV